MPPLFFVAITNKFDMNTSELINLRRRVAELEKEMQKMIDYFNRHEASVENRLCSLESKNSYPGYKPVDMSKAEYR
jgi:di/tripeptidase